MNSKQNKTHSVALVTLASGECVLSAFELGADGTPDTDNGLVFMRTVPADRAEALFADSCKLLACTAEQMRQEISGVQYAITSLTSCHNTECQREMETLARSVALLKMATLARKNPELEARKAEMLGYAAKAIEAHNPRRLVGNMSKIQRSLVAND